MSDLQAQGSQARRIPSIRATAGRLGHHQLATDSQKGRSTFGGGGGPAKAAGHDQIKTAAQAGPARSLRSLGPHFHPAGKLEARDGRS
jgi:hypothetical protein